MARYQGENNSDCIKSRNYSFPSSQLAKTLDFVVTGSINHYEIPETGASSTGKILLKAFNQRFPSS